MAIWERKDTQEIRYTPYRPSKNWHQVSESRVQEIKATKAIQRAKAQYEPGGGFGTGVEAAIARGRKKAVSVGAQELVGAGLAGTTMMGGLGKRYEEEVGMPARMSIEEERVRAMAGIEMQEAGMGFQAGQAGLQRGFQAGQATQQRELQRYIADLQARLQRESMAFRAQPTVAPTGGGYARQFPSLYDQDTAVPDWIGEGSVSSTADTPWPVMTSLSRQIPAQTTPPEMSEYLETYIPQTGDFSIR